MKISQTGVGTADSPYITDRNGSGLLPMQADGDGVTTFKVLGRADSGAPWVELVAAQTGDLLEAISWLPYVRLEVTAGAGTVNLYVATS